MADEKAESSAVIRFGEFRLDRRRLKLLRNAMPVKLGTKPCEVLAFLVDHQNQVVSKEALLEKVWGNKDGDPNLVEQNIRQIRRAIETDPKEPQLIVTITGSGYQFLMPTVAELNPVSAELVLNPSVNGFHEVPAVPLGVADESSSPAISNQRLPPSVRKIRRSTFFLVGAGLLAVLVLAIIVLYFTAPGEPATCEISVDTLIVKDGQGREMWRREFGERLNHRYYADHPPLCQYVDLNHDGVTDVVCSLKPGKPEVESDTLYGFITPSRLLRSLHAGPSRVLTFNPGAGLVLGPNGDLKIKRQYYEYLPPYSIESLFSKGVSTGQERIVVSSGMGEAPDQLIVLNGGFKKLGEYWHSGVLKYGQFATYKGRDRIFLGGVDNGYRSATVVAFDPDHVSGTTDLSLDLPDRMPIFAILATGDKSHVSPPGPGTETCRVLFSRSCVAKAKPHREPYNRVIDLRVTEERIFVTVAESEKEDSRVRVVYEMDRHFNLVEAGPTTEFRQRHMELERAGLLDHAFSPEELKPLVRVLPGCEFVEREK